MKLILIRHAESLRNVHRNGKAFYDVGQEKIGLPNHLIPITENGRRQADSVADTLYSKWSSGEHAKPAIMIHSGFVRTRDTANIIHSKLKVLAENDGTSFEIPMEQNHLLRERDAGHTFEMDSAEAEKYFPHLEDYWRLDGKWFAVPLGGESIVQVMDRVSIFLYQLAQNQKLKNSTVYAVTHGGTMTAFELVIKKVPFSEAAERVHAPKNCGVANYEYKEGVWVVNS
jgi:broad specificity phosphatase PhoE